MNNLEFEEDDLWVIAMCAYFALERAPYNNLYSFVDIDTDEGRRIYNILRDKLE